MPASVQHSRSASCNERASKTLATVQSGTDVQHRLSSGLRVGAAAAACPAAADSDLLLRRGCAVERSWLDSWLDSRVVGRRGLLGVEGFAVRARFDPDRSTQRTVLAAVNRYECHFRPELSDSPSPGFRRSHAIDCGVALHRISLLAVRRLGSS